MAASLNQMTFDNHLRGEHEEAPFVQAPSPRGFSSTWGRYLEGEQTVWEQEPMHVLAQALCGSPEHATAWNFGRDGQTVWWIVERFSQIWPGGVRWTQDAGPIRTRPTT